MSTRVVFMGSPEFSLPSLRALARDYEVVGVVTQPDRRAGRGRALKAPAVKDLAVRLGLPLLQPEKLAQPEARRQLQQWHPDLIVVAAFGQILRPEILALPQAGCLNVHASLLPRWRGAAPISAAILAGDQEGGVTIIKMDEGLDTGPIVSQRAIDIVPEDTAGALAESLSKLGAELLIETLPGYLSGKITPQAQPQEGVTHAPTLKKEAGRLDLTHPADELARRVRAFNPWPGAFLDLDGRPLKILRAHAEAGAPRSGERLSHNGKAAIGTGAGVLVFDEVQPAGKTAMSGEAYLAGARNWGIAPPEAGSSTSSSLHSPSQ